MNSHDKEFFSEIIDGREGKASRTRQFAWRRSSGSRFIYSSEKVEKADLQSLDRVWDRMREHVARNSSAYETNSNLATMSIDDILPDTAKGPVRKGRQEPELQKRRTFQHRIGMAAAVCIVTLLVGSMLMVMNTFRNGNSTTGASNYGRNASGHPSAVPSFIAGTISIIQLKSEVRFQTTLLTVPEGSGVLWHNQSTVSQVIVRDDKPVKYLTLTAGEQLPSPFLVAGSFSYHLQANPATHTTINVFHAIMIGSSKAGSPASFSPQGFKIKVGSTLLWTNTTNQAQGVISDTTGGVFKVSPRSSYSMPLDKTGVYTWHLVSNPGARITIVVIT